MDLLSFSQTLQLSNNNEVSEIEAICNMITKCQKNLSHYHHSVESSQWFYAQHSQLKRDKRVLIMSASKRCTFTL